MNERNHKYFEALIGCSENLSEKRVRTVHLHDNLGVHEKEVDCRTPVRDGLETGRPRVLFGSTTAVAAEDPSDPRS